MVEPASLTVALIGFGEAGQAFARDLAASGASLAVHDPRFAGPDGAALRARAKATGARPCADAAEAARDADIVVSAVTASAALAVAQAAADYLAAGQLFMDVNSVAPETRLEAAAAVEGAGALYVEAAVMAPVPPQGIAVPMLLGGPSAAATKALLDPFGANLQVVGEEIGRASAIKLSQSLMTKGIEALAVEAMLTARHYGTEDHIIDSLTRIYPGIDWRARMAYVIGRVMLHGRRRSEEMREAAKMVRAAGLEPLMTAATAERQAWVAELDADAGAVGVADPASLVDALRAYMGR